MDPRKPGLRIIKVPQWLSEEWLKAEAGAEVAEIDLESNVLKLLQVSQDPNKPKPTNFIISRRASPELFAFPVLEENQESRVEGGILEHLTVATNYDDPGYDKMVKERNETSAREQRHTKLTTDTSDNRQMFLATQNIKMPRKEEPSGDEPGKMQRGAIWTGVRKALLENPQGLSTEELLRYLPSMPPFLDVRNALSSLSEPIETDDGRRLFIQRRRTAAEVKVELKMEQEAGRNFKREQQAKREQSAKAEQAKAEQSASRSKKEEQQGPSPSTFTGGPPIKTEVKTEPRASASSTSTTSRPNARPATARAGSAGTATATATSSSSAGPTYTSGISSSAPPQKQARTQF